MADVPLTITQAVSKHAKLSNLWRILEEVNQVSANVVPVDHNLEKVLTYKWAVRTAAGDYTTPEGSDIEQGRLDWLLYASDLIESLYDQGRNVNGYPNLVFPAHDYDLTVNGRTHVENFPQITTTGVSAKEMINFPGGPKIHPSDEVTDASGVGPLVYKFTPEFYLNYFPPDISMSEIKLLTNGKIGLYYEWIQTSFSGVVSKHAKSFVGWHTWTNMVSTFASRVADPWLLTINIHTFNAGPHATGMQKDIQGRRARFVLRMYNWAKEAGRSDYTFSTTSQGLVNPTIVRLYLAADGQSLSATLRHLSGGALVNSEVEGVAVGIILKFDVAQAPKLFSISAEKLLRRTDNGLVVGPVVRNSGQQRTVYSPESRRAFKTGFNPDTLYPGPPEGYLHAHYQGLGAHIVYRESDYVEYPSPLSAGQLVIGTATRGQLASSAYGDYVAEYKYLKKLADDSEAVTGVRRYDHLDCLLTKSLSSLASSYMCLVVNGLYEYHDMARSFKSKQFSKDSLVFRHGVTDVATGESMFCLTATAGGAVVERNGLRKTAPMMVGQRVYPFVVVHPLTVSPPEYYSTDVWLSTGTFPYRNKGGGSATSSLDWFMELSSYIASETTTATVPYYGTVTTTINYHPTFKFILPPAPTQPLLYQVFSPLAYVKSSSASVTKVRPIATINYTHNNITSSYELDRRSVEGDGSVDFGLDDYDFTVTVNTAPLPDWGTDPSTGEFVVGVGIFHGVGLPAILPVAFLSDQALGAFIPAPPAPRPLSYRRSRIKANTLKSVDGPIDAPPLVVKLPIMGAITDADYGFTYALYYGTSPSQVDGGFSELYSCLGNPFFEGMPFKGPLRRFVTNTVYSSTVYGSTLTAPSYAEDSASFVGFVGHTYRVMHTGGKLAAYERSNTCPGTVSFEGGKLLFKPTGAGWEIFTLVDELNGVPYTMYMLVYDNANSMSLTSINNGASAPVGPGALPARTSRAPSSFGATALGTSLVSELSSSETSVWSRGTKVAVMGTYRNGSASADDYVSGDYGAHVDASPFEPRQVLVSRSAMNSTYGAQSYEHSDPGVSGMWSWVPGNLLGTHPQSGCRVLAVRFTTVMAVFDGTKNRRGIFEMSISVYSELDKFDLSRWDFFFVAGGIFCDELTAFAHAPAQMSSTRVLVDLNTYTGLIFDPLHFDSALASSISRAAATAAGTSVASAEPPLKVVWVDKRTGLMLSHEINVPTTYFTNRLAAMARR